MTTTKWVMLVAGVVLGGYEIAAAVVRFSETYSEVYWAASEYPILHFVLGFLCCHLVGAGPRPVKR